eukprot:TRINITY_DN16404_c0_g1_i1.p1 TRINITY_DN16404_c0_g1~~TRINITY_DN16404_c0_g1_i1.p1  ORF type:complete len:159 (-),score=15.15 TRINITY_DN16404_c0_g1_i1:50-526(-)
MFCVTILPVLCFLNYLPFSSAQSSTSLRRRCYTCRSRGEQGDCRDPFTPPEESEPGAKKESQAVSDIPCSTGWCSKLMEGVDKNFGDDDYGIATERQCMQRAPSDYNERCAYVKRNHKQVYMCFCKGDLCNGALGLSSSLVVMIVPLVLLLATFWKQF